MSEPMTGIVAAGTKQRVLVDTDGHLQVDVLSGGGGTSYTEGDTDATITGTAILIEGAANALAVPIGGAGAVSGAVQRVTLASDDPAVTSLAILDDWDESDRAKANIIVGQAGVAAGAGAVGATVQRVTLASDDPAVTALQLIDNPIVVDDAAFTPASTSVSMAGFQADETATDSVDEGDAGAARMTLDRKLIVTTQPHTAGGLSIFRSIDLDEGALEVVKASPGCLYGVWITNTATATRFIKFYDATSGTVGTGTPVITIGIPGNSSDDVSGMFSSTHGIAFATGICVGASTGLADNDTGAPGASEVVLNAFYK